MNENFGSVVEGTWSRKSDIFTYHNYEIGVGNMDRVSAAVNNTTQAIFGVDEKMEDGSDKGLENNVDDIGFQVGDYVWVKIRSRPWWPGQVYDPRDASEFALKHRIEDRLLVLFFGDGSCSWCLPSQLLRFVENFKVLSSPIGYSSKSFRNAKREAVNEIGRHVELKMMCKCVALEKRDDLAKPVVWNGGVKPGVLAPEIDGRRLRVPNYTPRGIISQVMNFARGVPIDNDLEFAVLRRWLAAFYHAKGGVRLPQWYKPLDIEESELLRSISMIDGPSMGERIHPGRKRKSMAELMGDKAKEKPKCKKRGTEGKDLGKPEVKSLMIEELKYDEDANGEAKEESRKWLTPRVRKKSKYLCYPYTTPTWSAKRDADDEKYHSSHAGVENDEESTFTILDVDLPVNEVLLEIQTAAVDALHMSKTGCLEKVWAFASAFRSSVYLHGSDNKVFQECKTGRKRKRCQETDLKLKMKTPKAGKGERKPHSWRSKKAVKIIDEEKSSSSDFSFSAVKVVIQKLDIMMGILEKHLPKFSAVDKSSLTEAMTNLLQNVEAVNVKVQIMAEKSLS